MRIVLPSCILRPWDEADAPVIAPHADDPGVASRLRDGFPHPYTVDDARTFIARARATDPPTIFAIEVEGGAAGSIGFHVGRDVERQSAEVGYWLGRRYWGRGIATEALRAVADHAFAAHGLLRLFAVPFADNPASARVLEKAGFVREGTMRRSAVKAGRVLDQWLYARTDLDGQG
jgi:[ribosomal protein S5]-alanine N-acetyltransferase